MKGSIIISGLVCILLGILIHGIDGENLLPKSLIQDETCFADGECTSSTLLTETTTLDDLACLTFCQRTTNCTHFSFYPRTLTCRAFIDCPKINLDCPECVSGQSTCVGYDPCLFVGTCQGSIISQVPTGSNQECMLLCSQNENCEWSTYDVGLFFCTLFQNCPTLDETCENCLSSMYHCRSKNANSKLFVATGYAEAGYTNSVEIIDLESSSSTCPGYEAYPLAVYGATGGASGDSVPIICGGFDGATHTSACFYHSGTWRSTSGQTVAREFGAVAEFPYNKLNYRFIVTGGFNPVQLNKNEYRHSDGNWYPLADIPVTVTYHCIVPYNSTSFLLIGGYQNLTLSTRETFLYSVTSDSWSPGPRLNFGRQGHSCARVQTFPGSHTYSIVVAGGTNGSSMNSVEILHSLNGDWEVGPSLPVATTFASLVEDRAGGVILVGGFSNQYLGDLYRLSHLDEGAQWIKLPQTLTVPRRAHSAFTVQSSINVCPLNPIGK